VAQTLLRAHPRAGLAADAVHHVFQAHDHAGVVREAVVVGVRGALRFRPASELTPQAIAITCEQVRVRVLRWFARSGLIHSDDVCEILARENSGFSVDAEVWIAARDRAGLERLLRYWARPQSRANVSSRLTIGMSSTAYPDPSAMAPQRCRSRCWS
jgi:hypothetical protein